MELLSRLKEQMEKDQERMQQEQKSAYIPILEVRVTSPPPSQQLVFERAPSKAPRWPPTRKVEKRKRTKKTSKKGRKFGKKETKKLVDKVVVSEAVELYNASTEGEDLITLSFDTAVGVELPSPTLTSYETPEVQSKISMEAVDMKEGLVIPTRKSIQKTMRASMSDESPEIPGYEEFTSRIPSLSDIREQILSACQGFSPN